MKFKSNESFRPLIESTDELIWSVDLEHRLTAFKDSVEKGALRKKLENRSFGGDFEIQ